MRLRVKGVRSSLLWRSDRRPQQEPFSLFPLSWKNLEAHCFTLIFDCLEFRSGGAPSEYSELPDSSKTARFQILPKQRASRFFQNSELPDASKTVETVSFVILPKQWKQWKQWASRFFQNSENGENSSAVSNTWSYLSHQLGGLNFFRPFSFMFEEARFRIKASDLRAAEWMVAEWMVCDLSRCFFGIEYRKLVWGNV